MCALRVLSGSNEFRSALPSQEELALPGNHPTEALLRANILGDLGARGHNTCIAAGHGIGMKEDHPLLRLLRLRAPALCTVLLPGFLLAAW